MTDHTPLSPAAQAVLDACCEADNGHYEDDTWHPAELEVQLAAALRAAAHRAIRGPEHYEGLGPCDYDDGWNEALDYIMAIATELEGTND